jgi:hypothetical protein
MAIMASDRGSASKRGKIWSGQADRIKEKPPQITRGGSRRVEKMELGVRPHFDRDRWIILLHGMVQHGNRMQPVPESKRRRAPTDGSLRKKMSELISLRERVAQAELAAGIARLANGQGVVTEGELKS